MFLSGYDWKDDSAVDKLKMMLWGLEALRMFEERLSISLSKIEKARDDLKGIIDNVRLQSLIT